MEPEFSSLASAEHIQGTVVLQVVVTEKGRTSDIEVLSPLGFGLDEKAEEAVKRWEFIPGKKAGLPVAIRATVEVTFRWMGLSFDENYEARRTKFNVALQSLRHDGPKTKEDTVKTMLALAKQDFPGALFLVGEWELVGDYNLPKDPVVGLAKIQKAANKNYGPAVYEIALRSINDSSQQAKAWDKMRLAATLGSEDAQVFLGDHYQKGDGVEQSTQRAKNYFRLCAARGKAECQFRLARLMFDASDRPDYEYEQALAWFQLASDQGVNEATQIVEGEKLNLTASQQKVIDVLKRQFTGNFN